MDAVIADSLCALTGKTTILGGRGGGSRANVLRFMGCQCKYLLSNLPLSPQHEERVTEMAASVIQS